MGLFKVSLLLSRTILWLGSLWTVTAAGFRRTDKSVHGMEDDELTVGLAKDSGPVRAVAAAADEADVHFGAPPGSTPIPVRSAESFFLAANFLKTFRRLRSFSRSSGVTVSEETRRAWGSTPICSNEHEASLLWPSSTSNFRAHSLNKKIDLLLFRFEELTTEAHFSPVRQVPEVIENRINSPTVPRKPSDPLDANPQVSHEKGSRTATRHRSW